MHSLLALQYFNVFTLSFKPPLFWLQSLIWNLMNLVIAWASLWKVLTFHQSFNYKKYLSLVATLFNVVGIVLNLLYSLIFCPISCGSLCGEQSVLLFWRWHPCMLWLFSGCSIHQCKEEKGNECVLCWLRKSRAGHKISPGKMLESISASLILLNSVTTY